MKKKTLYLVHGESGEWEERRTWTVIAYKTAKAADAFRNSLTKSQEARAKKYNKQMDKWRVSEGDSFCPKFVPDRRDPMMNEQTTYRIWPIRFIEL